MKTVKPIFLRILKKEPNDWARWAALACAGFLQTSCAPTTQECVDDQAFFRDQVQAQVLEPVCMACHTSSGAARDSQMVFSTVALPNYLAVNEASIHNMASLERDGASWLLQKSLGNEDHGGGAILLQDSEEYAILEQFVLRSESPVVCEDNEKDFEPEELGLVLASPAATLRKATIQLAGRLPSPDETEMVFLHGEEGLADALDLMVETPKFIDIMKELWNDTLLTDKYHACCGAIGLVDYDRYYSLYWYSGTEDANTKRSYLNQAIAREPLEIIGYVIDQDRPFTEILTADYTMVNAYSALSYGVSYGEAPDVADPSGFVFYPTQLDGVPHAGILTTPAYLNRYPTTATNRNRHRSWAFQKNFLATDILQMADRPIDITGSIVHNPTQNDPQCNVCHAVMEPIAGLFQNWDRNGAMYPLEDGWYPEMFTPGFNSTELPPSDKAVALQWLAEKTITDNRFPLAIARQTFAGVTGLPVIDGTEAILDPGLKDAWLQQSAFLEQLATDFADDGFQYKGLVKQIVLSHYYRTIGEVSATEATLTLAGTAKLLSPEQLNRKIEMTTGLPWRKYRTSSDYLLDRYRMLYGGLDSNSVTDRLDEPNGIIANIGLRMATEVACVTVTNDFVVQQNQRRLFPWVEPGYQPITPDGLPVPEAIHRIKKNLQYLHYRLNGEQLALDGPEIDGLYQLWHDTWWEGRQRVAAEEESTSLHYLCDVHHDYWTGQILPAEERLYADIDYTLRAWMAVMTFELSDYRFLYQ
jgi:hypothetical protein